MNDTQQIARLRALIERVRLLRRLVEDAERELKAAVVDAGAGQQSSAA